MGGVLNKTVTEVEVEALPGALPNEIIVDVSKLEDFNSVLHVSDLEVGEGVTIVTDPELTIATVSAPRAEEEAEELSPEEMEKQALEAAVGAEEGESEGESESKE
jgi:large subunit ribosomal protein L25